MHRFLKCLRREEKGITGLETAIILIAFVVVAAVLAYTVLSAGLFATQKSQESVYSGLKESQSSMELKGAVVANGKASLDTMDYPLGWVADADATVTRETTTKWEGSASLKAVVAAGMIANDTVMYRAMQAIDFTNGDTITFWVKTDAALEDNLTFALATGTNLQGTATEVQAINTTGTAWEKVTVTLSGGDDDTAAYFGIYLDTDDDTGAAFYVDKIVVDNVASQGGIPIMLDHMDYLRWVADSDVTVTRETTDKLEGSASLKGVVAADATLNDSLVYRAMTAKDWTDGDTVTFWVKAEAALDSNMTFALATGVDLQGTATQTQLINPSGTGWEKHTVTLSGGDDDSAAYFGIYLSTDAAGTFYLDGIQIDSKFNTNIDPMTTYANSVVFTVANVLGGEPIDFSTTSDADTDGIISDESTRTHKIIIYFSDQYQQITDLTWTKTAIGKDDGDNLLEPTEKFQITVDLTNVNNSAGWDFKKVSPYHEFTLEVKPPTGGVLAIERTLPNLIKNVNDLN